MNILSDKTGRRWLEMEIARQCLNICRSVLSREPQIEFVEDNAGQTWVLFDGRPYVSITRQDHAILAEMSLDGARRFALEGILLPQLCPHGC